MGPKTLAELRTRVGLVFQDPDDQLFMPTVEEDVAFGPLNMDLDREEIGRRVTEALAAVRMSTAAERAPYQLSMGERRRVAIATVLAMRPSLLVLDEPSANLDPRARRELIDILAGNRAHDAADHARPAAGRRALRARRDPRRRDASSPTPPATRSWPTRASSRLTTSSCRRGSTLRWLSRAGSRGLQFEHATRR